MKRNLLKTVVAALIRGGASVAQYGYEQLERQMMRRGMILCMILDENLLLDTDAAITTTRDSTNVIDLGVNEDMGIGDGDQITPKLMVLVTTAFTSTGSGTLAVSFSGSTDNSTWDEYLTTPALAKTVLTAGARLLDIDMPRPAAGKKMPRYLKLTYTVATADFSAGKVTAAIVLGRDDQPAVGYPSGFTVSN